MKAFFLSLWQNDILRLALDSAFKLVLAAVCGGFIGYERQHSHRPAGFRTHILVAVGAALVMITSSFLTDQYQEVMQIDPTRMSAQVISGIGFLGAGTILREGFSVKGLTTAASLWAVSCVGIAVGSGFYAGALIATLVIYLTLNLLKRISARGNAGRNLYVEVEDVGLQASRVGEGSPPLWGRAWPPWSCLMWMGRKESGKKHRCLRCWSIRAISMSLI